LRLRAAHDKVTAMPVAVPTLREPGSVDPVVLRPHREADVDALVEQSEDAESIRWINVPLESSREQALEFVREIIPAGWEQGQWAFAVEATDVDGARRFAGTVWLRDEGHGRAEIAYGAHPWARGRGIVERALRVLLDWGFADRGLRTVIWWAHEGNWPSRRVAWRLGFSFDGTVRGWLVHRGELRDAWVGELRWDDPRRPRSEWFDVPRILGEKVTLRMHRDEDAVRVLEACTDERTAYWLGQMPHPYTAAHAERFVRLRSMGMAAGTDLNWMVADPDDDRLLATVSVLRIQRPIGEIGYWTHPEARGRGVMTEAVRLAVRHAFVPQEEGGLGLTRLEAYAAVDNTASRHVLDANGFRSTGVHRRAIRVRDGMHDMACYELLPEDPGWRLSS
jgi:RimJ/RimL family protein N-acetyltransferase